jgi:hypothetical protein
MLKQGNERRGWLFVVALAATTTMTAPPASAQPDPVQVPAAGVGMPAPALPTTAPAATAGRVANAAPNAGPANTAVPPTHRETLDDCMGYWDAQTHMSRTEWRQACRRTLNGTDMGSLDLLNPGYAAADGPRRRGLRTGVRP